MPISPNFADLLKPDVEMKEFPDGDDYVRLPGLSAHSGRESLLFHRLYPLQDKAVFQAMLMLDTMRKAGAKPVLVSPYLPYSRQDKIFLEGEPLSAEVLCRMLRAAGAERLITLDCHFMKKPGIGEYGGLAIENVSMGEALIAHAKKKLGSNELEVISPDAGASYLVEGHGGKSMKKVRGEYAGEKGVAYRRIEKLERGFEVSGKNILILDDMISTGGTMVRAVENVKKGGAAKVLCAATHGFFLKDSLATLRSASDAVFTSNSIPNPAAEVDFMPVLKARGINP